MACETLPPQETSHPPKHRDGRKAPSSQGLAARAAIERDGPNPSEPRTDSVTGRVLDVPATGISHATPGADETERKGSHHGERNEDHDDKDARLHAADGRDAVLWDITAPGLGLRTQPSGHKSWIVHRRCNGSVVKRTLGPFDALTVEDARHAAQLVIAETEAGDAVVTVPTVRAFARTFLADCTERWKPATRENYAVTVRRWILLAVGNRPVDSIGAKAVRTWRDGIAATRPASAN